MSLVKKTESYTNSLTTLRRSSIRDKLNQSPSLVIIKKQKKKSFYALMCCFCVPKNNDKKQSLKNKKNDRLTEKLAESKEVTTVNVTSMFVEENQKQEETFTNLAIYQSLKSKSHFGYREIMTPALPKSKKSRHLNVKNSQIIKRNRSEENIANLINSNFPKNQLYFLKFNEKNYLIARNIHVNFKNYHPPTNKTQYSYDDKQNDYNLTDIFSLKNKGVKVDSESIIISDPECVMRHLSKKIKNYDTILEFGCGVGNLTINFAKKCDMVYAIDPNVTKLNYAGYNAKIYGVQQKIIFIQSNSLKNLVVKPDLIFLNPEWEIKNKYHIDSHLLSFHSIKPDLSSLLEETLKFSQNIIIVLPKYINFNEFALILARMEEKNLLKGHKYSIEFEFIHINNKLWKIYAFIGVPNTITHQEEIEFLSVHLNEDIDCDVLFKENTTILKQIDNRIGLRTLIRILPEIFSKEYGYNKTSTFFQIFLDALKSLNLISNAEISEFLMWSTEKPKKSIIMKNLHPQKCTFSRNTSCNLFKKLEEKCTNIQENEVEYYHSEYSSESIGSKNESDNANCYKDKESLIRMSNYKSFKNEILNVHSPKPKTHMSFS